MPKVVHLHLRLVLLQGSLSNKVQYLFFCSKKQSNRSYLRKHLGSRHCLSDITPVIS